MPRKILLSRFSTEKQHEVTQTLLEKSPVGSETCLVDRLTADGETVNYTGISTRRCCALSRSENETPGKNPARA
jgi:hypothetical protein